MYIISSARSSSYPKILRTSGKVARHHHYIIIIDIIIDIIIIDIIIIDINIIDSLSPPTQIQTNTFRTTFLIRIGEVVKHPTPGLTGLVPMRNRRTIREFHIHIEIELRFTILIHCLTE